MGIPTLISTSTASNATSVDITSGIDSTYDEYMFVFTDINPATDSKSLTFQVNAASGSGFNETITSTNCASYNYENDSSSAVEYNGTDDQAQGTDYQVITTSIGNGADESGAGVLHLFNPSSTTYVKHFYSRTSSMNAVNSANDVFIGGYINTTSAIDEISFKMSSGNFDGVIQMFGIA